MPFEKNETVQEQVRKYQSAFSLFPARLHLPVIVCQIKRAIAIDTKFQNCFYPERREEKRSGMSAGQMPFPLLHTVTCQLRCFRCLPGSVVRRPDACQGLTRHG